MKICLLYFFAFLLVTALLPVAAEHTVAGDSAPIITVESENGVLEYGLEEYTLSVLLAEGEKVETDNALKALSVAIRSQALYISQKGLKHESFDVCSKGDCCLPLKSESDVDSELLERCKNAVSETSGEVLIYESKPALTLFTLCSGSGTSDCAEFPYLVGVSEPERCEKHKTTVEWEFSNSEPLFSEYTSINELKNNSCIVYDKNKKCAFGVFSGRMAEWTEICNSLNLPSREIVLEFNENGIKAQSYGVGNGYGLNLCKADSYDGDYMEILKKYYPLLTFIKIE